MLHRLEADSPLASLTHRRFQPAFQLLATRLVNREVRTSIHLDAPVINAEHMLLAPEFAVKKVVHSLGAPHLQTFGGRHRPGEDREDDQHYNDDLGLNGRVAPNELKLHLVFGRQHHWKIHSCTLTALRFY